MIGIVDCNNFYCSCERVFNPGLNGKPVVVLSNNDGCVIARSEEAKALGITMGQPAFLSEQLFKKNGVHVFSSNYALYGDMSERVMRILSQFTSDIELYSIDEAFIDLKGILSLDETIRTIRKTVIKYTGIPISIGVAPTKTLAKVANKLAKKLNGICVLENEDEINFALANFDIEDIWGVGRQYKKFLQDHAIVTGLDLKYENEEWVYKNMTVVGLRIQKELKGESCIDIENEAKLKKSISTTRSFGTLVEDVGFLREAVATYAHRLSQKLRKEKACARFLNVFIRTNPFMTTLPQVYLNKVLAFPVPTNDTQEIIHYALKGLSLIYKKGYKYNKAGVVATGIVPDSQIQSNLFDSQSRNLNRKLSSSLDKLNSIYGKGKVSFATEGIEKSWKLKCEKLSNRYTTRWEEILEIKL